MKKLLTILILIMLIISFFQITNMYALYKDKLQSEYNTKLGVWEIKVNGTDITNGTQVLTFEIDPDTQLEYVESEYVQAGSIAPGTQAYFEIVIDPTNTDVSIVYQLNLESIDIPNADMELISVDNVFKKDGEDDVTNSQTNIDGNLYTAVMPIERITQGYKNYLGLTFKWINDEDNNTPDTILSNAQNATNNNITWASSNESVATISNGVITAVSAGTSTITVTTADGSFTDTCVVTVTEDEVTETISAVSAVLDKTQATIKKGETKLLSAIVYPYNVTNRNIVWTSNNTDVATVTNGVVTGVAAGTATITVKTVDGNFTDTCTVTVTNETIEDTLAVTEVELDKSAITLQKGATESLQTTIWSERQKLSIPLQMNLKQYTGEDIGDGPS